MISDPNDVPILEPKDELDEKAEKAMKVILAAMLILGCVNGAELLNDPKWAKAAEDMLANNFPVCHIASAILQGVRKECELYEFKPATDSHHRVATTQAENRELMDDILDARDSVFHTMVHKKAQEPNVAEGLFLFRVMHRRSSILPGAPTTVHMSVVMVATDAYVAATGFFMLLRHKFVMGDEIVIVNQSCPGLESTYTIQTAPPKLVV